MSEMPISGTSTGSMEHALVSVIIRTKNRAELLRRALASVAKQTYAPIEILVINDGDDDIQALCQQAAPAVQKLHVIKPAPAGGRVNAANTGLQHASGAYLIFLDDDDWFYPDHVLKLITALNSAPQHGLAYTGIECKREDPQSGELVKEHEFNQPFDAAFFLIRNFIPIHAALFRRSLLDSETIFDTQLDYYEDWDFWLQLYRKTPFLYVPGISACYFLGGSSGFGIDQGDARQQRAEEIFFSKWQQRWSTSEVQLIINVAREVPALRQDAHDTHIKLQQLYLEHEALQQQLSELANNFQQLKTEHQQVTSQLDATSLMLEATLQSNSWRITEPLRNLAFWLRDVRSSLANIPLRLSNVRSIVAARGVAGLWQHIQAKTHNASAAPPPLITPFSLREIQPDAFYSVVEKLKFSTSAPVVSVIIPAYNHLALTLACLQSLSENPQLTPFEVIVVDDKSSDETAAVLSGCAALHYLSNNANSGFIRTCNKGAAHAKGKYLFFLNNDTEVQQHWLDPLVAVLDQQADAGIAGSKLVYPSGHLQEAGTSLRADGSVDMIGLNGNPYEEKYCRVREVDHCSGAAILIRADLFRQVGGFDECYAPAYFEDCDLSLKIRQAGFRVLFQPESVVVHHLSVTTENLPGGKLAQIERNKYLYLKRWGKTLQEADKIRLIAFYLPQFHTIPENDLWWGEGFTEWTNVNRAIPLFKDHYQPHRPAELGYYDLRETEIKQQQANLAREHGIYGFCYYHYWFNGKRLLEGPLNEILQSGKPDFPFCVCWANENWTRRWDGRESEVLMAQQYNEQSNVQFILDLLPVLADKRYIRINGRPLLLIYRAELIPGLSQAISEWRKITREAGLGEVYLAAVESFSGVHSDLAEEFDALVEFPPHARSVAVEVPPQDLVEDFKGQLFDYAASAANFMNRTDTSEKLFRTAMPAWDNTARRMNAAHIYLDATPQCYQQWLSHIATQTRNLRTGEERIVFVNAWNEWAEGNHLEPDERNGRDYLEATRSALGVLGHYPLLKNQLYQHDSRYFDDASVGHQPGLNLIGHPYAVLGRAEDIRTAALSCRQAEIPLQLMNLNGDYDAHLSSVHSDFPLFDLVKTEPEYCANLFYLNADEMHRAWETYGNRLAEQRYNIACFAWELSNFPEPWLASFKHLNEIWAPTRFIQEALLPVTDIPVIHMPFVIEPGDAGLLSREAMALPQNKFIFLFFFDFRSYVSRKNPQAVLEAFFQAFPVNSSEAVHLVIKVNGIEDQAEQYQRFLQDERLQDGRIQILDGSLDDRGIKSLVAACDCFVSLHRSEGFGRGLAEAMYYGKPVIATAYSGNLDFMNTENSCLVDYQLIPLKPGEYPHWEGQVWADADVAQAAAYMRRLFAEPAYAQGIGEQARQTIRTHHSATAVGKQQRQRLEQLGIIRPL